MLQEIYNAIRIINILSVITLLHYALKMDRTIDLNQEWLIQHGLIDQEKTLIDKLLKVLFPRSYTR